MASVFLPDHHHRNVGVADHAGGVRAQQVSGDRRITRANHHHVGFQLTGQFVYGVAHAAKTDVGFDARWVNGEVLNHGLQSGFGFG